MRLDPDLHAALRAEAAARNVSLNELCARTLAEHAFDPVAGAFGPVVRRALGLFEGALVGLVAFGSWARGDAAPGSDVDVLVVVAPGIDVTRELYRRWDVEPVTCDGRAVDPHFIVLPDPAAPVSGVWADAARDGIVVFERSHQVSRHLGHVRRQVLSGVRRRSTAHGQPYWSTPSPEVAHAES